MNKLLLAILMAATSSSAFADWTLVVETVGGNKYFIDPTTIKHVGEYVHVTQLADYVNLQAAANINWKSDISEIRFDCKNTNSLSIDVKLFAENHANGELVANYIGGNENDIKLIASDTSAALIYDFVCDTNIY